MTEWPEYPKEEKCLTRGCDNVVIRTSKQAARFCRKCRDDYGREQREANERRRRSYPIRSADTRDGRAYARRLTEGWAMLNGYLPEVEEEREL